MFGRDQKPAIVLLLRVEEVHLDFLEDVLPGSEQELAALVEAATILASHKSGKQFAFVL